MQHFCGALLTMKRANAIGVVHYHARFRERSMRYDGNHEEVSRKGAKAQSRSNRLTTKYTKYTKKKEGSSICLTALRVRCVLCGDFLCGLAPLREIFPASHIRCRLVAE